MLASRRLQKHAWQQPLGRGQADFPLPLPREWQWIWTTLWPVWSRTQGSQTSLEGEDNLQILICCPVYVCETSFCGEKEKKLQQAGIPMYHFISGENSWTWLVWWLAAIDWTPRPVLLFFCTSKLTTEHCEGALRDLCLLHQRFPGKLALPHIISCGGVELGRRVPALSERDWVSGLSRKIQVPGSSSGGPQRTDQEQTFLSSFNFSSANNISIISSLSSARGWYEDLFLYVCVIPCYSLPSTRKRI